MPRKRLPTVRPGDVVAIHFIDHATGDTEFPFIVYGRVSTHTRTAITVDSWAHEDPDTDDAANVDNYTIVRAAITKIEHLIPRGD